MRPLKGGADTDLLGFTYRKKEKRQSVQFLVDETEQSPFLFSMKGMPDLPN